MSAIYNFNAVIADAVQQGILALKFEDCLDSKAAYSAFTHPVKMAGKVGDTLTFTQNSRMNVNLTESAPDDGTHNLDNNTTPEKSGLEQYTITLKQWNTADKVNLLQDEAMISSDLDRCLENLAVNLMMKKERLVRRAYMNDYLGGNTKVLATGTLSTTTCRVDNINGFTHVLDAGGAVVAVSGTNTLLVDEIDANGNVVQTLTVTGAVTDTNVSSLKGGSDNSFGGRSGQITYTTATIPIANNALKARNAPRVFRAGGRVHSGLISAGDITTTDNLDDIVTYMRNQGDFLDDGFVYALAGPSAMRQWRRDPQFQNAYTGRYEAPEIRAGKITEYGGVRFIETNEVPITINADGTEVHRVLFVTGKKACGEAVWEGFDNFVNEKANSPIRYVKKVQQNAAIFVRQALDLYGEQQPIAYKIVTGFSCGSDMLANENIIPTASGSMFKKAAWLEFAAQR